jgi:hypothetical protein
MRKLFRFAIIPLVAIAVLVLAGPANATVFISDGNASGPPPTEGGKVCLDSGGTYACFTPLGDKIWVFDDAADGHHAEGELRINPTDPDVFNCRNFTGYGTWRVCNNWSDLIPEHLDGIFCAQTYEGNTPQDGLCDLVRTTYPL